MRVRFTGRILPQSGGSNRHGADSQYIRRRLIGHSSPIPRPCADDSSDMRHRFLVAPFGAPRNDTRRMSSREAEGREGSVACEHERRSSYTHPRFPPIFVFTSTPLDQNPKSMPPSPIKTGLTIIRNAIKIPPTSPNR
jgi:hypothetical protein